MPAPVMTDNLAAPVPEKCCFCFYQPGGHLMAKSHYALSLIALIIGIVVGVDDKRSVHFDFFLSENLIFSFVN